MKGSVVDRRPKDENGNPFGPFKWGLVLDLDPVVDPVTGARKRKQKWISFTGTKKEADTELRRLLGDVDKGQFVEPSKLTFIAYMADWIEKAKSEWRVNTYATYKSIFKNHLVGSVLANIPLQRLRASDLKSFLDKQTVEDSTKVGYYVLLHMALEDAMRDGLVHRNVARLVVGKPKAPEDSGEDVSANCWDREEARTFLRTAQSKDPQTAALYTLGLESGCRKAELCGLRWGKDGVDLDRGRVRIMRQLIKGGSEPVFGPTKNGKARTIDLSPATVRILRAHKTRQAEIKLANRLRYHDHGLVFAKEWSNVMRGHDVLGHPLAMRKLGAKHLDPLIEAAGVKRITFHGLRHTCATLLLESGVNPRVVQERLGHAKITITLQIYGHVLPGMQEGATALLGGLLQG